MFEYILNPHWKLPIPTPRRHIWLGRYKLWPLDNWSQHPNALMSEQYYFLLHAKHSTLSAEPGRLLIVLHVSEFTNLIQCKTPHLELHTDPGRWCSKGKEQLTSWQSRSVLSHCVGFKSESVFREHVLENHIYLGNPFPFPALIGWSPQLT